ncbi:RNA 3'-terminal phosphate cyclase [uncultured bacterium]|nr:RNA 3'-terminal phosphate cyclase [uncultured bacterium]
MPFRIYNLRSRRKRPGLRPQHALSARAAAQVTKGSLEGCVEGSRTLTYLPGKIKSGRYFFDCGTAGSLSLVFQTILAPLAFSEANSSVTFKGGTHVPWSPPTCYIEEVFLPLLSPIGLAAGFSTVSRGYYPAGGGEASAQIKPVKAPLAPFIITGRGKLVRVRVTSAVSNLPLSIAERQLNSASELLSNFPVETVLTEAPSPGRGTSVFILAEFENSRAGFSALGAPVKRAEAVGVEAAMAFLEYMGKEGALDPHLSDQALIYMALAGGESSFTTTEITGHLLTNVHVIEKFLPVKFSVEGPAGFEGSVAVRGAGFEKRFSG